jgi:hypothetical protein
MALSYQPGNERNEREDRIGHGKDSDEKGLFGLEPFYINASNSKTGLRLPD